MHLKQCFIQYTCMPIMFLTAILLRGDILTGTVFQRIWIETMVNGMKTHHCIRWCRKTLCPIATPTKLPLRPVSVVRVAGIVVRFVLGFEATGSAHARPKQAHKCQELKQLIALTAWLNASCR